MNNFNTAPKGETLVNPEQGAEQHMGAMAIEVINREIKL